MLLVYLYILFIFFRLCIYNKIQKKNAKSVKPLYSIFSCCENYEIQLVVVCKNPAAYEIFVLVSLSIDFSARIAQHSTTYDSTA